MWFTSTLRCLKVKALFYPMFLDFRKSAAFFNVPRLRPFVLLLRVKSMKHRSNYINRGKTKYSDENKSQCQFVHHKSYVV
jgi:hypothetical protein